MGQSNQVYSGHTSEIGMTEDGKVGHAIIFGGDGSVGSTTIQYFDASGNPSGAPQMVQGGTDKVDLVYTFKPAGDVPFTKAVFSAIDNNLAFGQQSDYLIHSIKYKEVNDGETTTIIGSNEVAFKIETSVKPDPSFTNPTADVKIVDNLGNTLFEGTVNLDANGKAIVSVRTDGTLNLTATVTNVKGNFEAVDYTNNEATISATIIASAEDDSIILNEDTQYILAITDFGDSNQNIAQVKFNTVPENGKIYVLKTEYTGSMNDRAEYTSSENKVYVELKADDIVDISKIEEGSLIFVPNENTDNSGSFTFSVSNGNGIFNGDYTTTININAVADAPEINMEITTIGEITIPSNDGNSANNSSNDTNLILALNLNSSLVRYEDENGKNGFEIVRESTISLIEDSKAKGNTMVELVLYGNKVINLGWMEAEQAINYLNSIEIEYLNHYGKTDNWSDFKVDGEILELKTNTSVNARSHTGGNIYKLAEELTAIDIEASEQTNAVNKVYIISEGSGINDPSYFYHPTSYTSRSKEWDKFVETNNVKVTAISLGIGNDQVKELNGLETFSKENEVIKLNNPSELNNILDNTTEELAYKYEIDIEAALTDTDGSERLEVYLKNLPEDSKLFDKNGVELEANTSGKYSIELDSGEAKLTLISSSEISDIDLNSIKASAVAIEESNSDSFTTTTTINQILGTTIELTGLKDLLDDQGHIDLKLSESKDNVTLTLKDLIELKGSNDIIKITGDKFDSVQLKNEDNHTWEKAEDSIIDGDSIYEVYIGYIDDMHSIQVHIEQHISDGITN